MKKPGEYIAHTDTVECYRNSTKGWEILKDYAYIGNGYGHYKFDMVNVRNEVNKTESIFITGGIRYDQFEKPTESRLIYRLGDLADGSFGWEEHGRLLQPRTGHRSWVSYGLQLQEGPDGRRHLRENGDFDNPMVFSVGGHGADGVTENLDLEYSTIKFLTSSFIYN